jgi:hypothetical protein
VGTQAVIDLHFLQKSRTSRRVNLHHLIRIVRVIDHRSIIPRTEKLPGLGNMVDFHRVMGIYALDSEPWE